MPNRDNDDIDRKLAEIAAGMHNDGRAGCPCGSSQGACGGGGGCGGGGCGGGGCGGGSTLPPAPADIVDPQDRELIPVTGVNSQSLDVTNLEEDGGEPFIPPDPPRTGLPDNTSLFIFAGLVGVPIFLLICLFAWRNIPGILTGIGVVWFLAAFVMMVIRLPKGGDDDTDDRIIV